MNISFIGFGHMAKAIAKGLLHNPQFKLRAASPSLTIGINAEGITTHHDNLAVLPQTDILILAVKPINMAEVLSEIKEAIPNHCLVVSVAAGLSLSWLAKQCRQGQAIVRCMPNSPVTLKMGATPLIANQIVSQKEKERVTQLFESLGIIAWTTQESDLDIFTALSGSGPAYVFLFLQAMIEAAMQLGLTQDIAKAFSLQTMSGAIALASKSSLDTHALIDAVTSKGGTTAAAFQVFQQAGFKQIILKAIQAAQERAKELGTLAT